MKEILVTLMLILFLSACSDINSFQRGQEVTTVRTAWIAIDEDTYDELGDLIDQHNVSGIEALQQTGDIDKIYEGTTLTVVDPAYSYDMVQVRLPDGTEMVIPTDFIK